MAKKTAGQQRENPGPAASNLAGGRRAEEALRLIVDGITSQVGEQFFRALVRHLASALKVRIAFVSEQLDHEGARLRLIALWEGDDYGENFAYPTKGTPCERVVGKGLASFPSGLRELFPEDAWLREVSAESYLAVPLFDSTERPLGHLGVMHDEPMCEELRNEQILRIFAERAGGELERKRAEEALRDSEERYRALVEASPDGISLTDLEGRVLFCNKQALALLGIESMQEVLGRNAFDLIAPEDRQRALDNAQKTLNMKSISHVEYTLVRKDGSRFPAEMGASLVVDAEGKPKGFIGVVRDITKRKRAEEALRESEEKYRALYEDNPSMYFTVDAEGTVLSVNRFGAEQLGYTVDELVGQSVLKVFYEADKEAVQKQLSMCVQNSAEVADWEFRKVRKDGSILWVKEAARAVRGPDGGTIVLIVCEDITQRKEAEEALQKAREELESKVESRMQMESPYGLTFRELATLHLVAEGKSDKEIATLLGISPRTANKHLENILSKMGASSRTEAGVRAVRERLLGQ